MKNLSIALNVVLVIAVVVLFILHFSSNKSTESGSMGVNETGDTLQANANKSDDIAYIYVDSLLSGYKYYSVLEDKLRDKKSSLEASLNRKRKAFEDDYIKYMEKAQRGSFLSQERAREEEQRLAKDQENLMLYEQDINRELMEESQGLEAQLLDTVVNYLKEFNADKRYRYILNAGSCLYLNEGSDVTKVVITELNNRYESYLQEVEIPE